MYQINKEVSRTSVHPYPLQPSPPSRTLEEGLKWYVVQSKPREEERALYFLERKNLQAYLPRIEVVNIRGCRSVIKQKPLFPSYLFCRFDPEESLAHVRWTKGVAKTLPESVSPIPISEAIIAAIRAVEQEDGIIRKKPFKKNDRIRIARGPMEHILGIFDHWTSDQGRVRVLLNFINYQASVELHHSFVERVG